MNITRLSLMLLVSMTLLACQQQPETPVNAAQPSAAANSDTQTDSNPDAADSSEPPGPSAELAGLFEEYFEASLQMNPIQATFIGDKRYNDQLPNFFSAEYRQKTHDFDVKWLNRVQAIDRDSLSEQDKISYDLFVYQQQQTLEGEQYPDWMQPVSQFFSVHNFFAQLGSGVSAQPFQTVEDYDNWLSRIDGMVVLNQQAIENMRQGMVAGVVQPEIVMQKVLPQLQAHIVDDVEQSVFYGPVNNLPESFSEQDRQRLSEAYRVAISEQVIPIFQSMHDFIRDEYLPASRATVGMSHLPNGTDWYNFRIKAQTTTSKTADEIHQFGLDEVARIRGEMEQVMQEVGFEGDLQEFFAWLKGNDEFYYTDKEALLQGYRDLQAKVNERLPNLFDVAPKADYEVRAVEAFREQSQAGASYQPSSPDGSRPGIFYVNTYNLRAQPKYGMETLSLHEASPGHHFQIAIQQEIEEMPKFRRFGGYTAFAEGWALYAESIGREMGMFDDPYQYFGRLSDEMLRAMRLVVDTGMHAKGWTREQAIDYMRANSDMAESAVIAEVERYIVIAGQALAYKMGQSVISELRARAERELGDDFDIKAFHRVVLTGGAMPMDILRQRVNSWINEVKSARA